MTSHSHRPPSGIDWTQVLKNAGIPEPPWDEQECATVTPPVVKALELDDHENWMHR
jgi:hypothetical protein